MIIFKIILFAIALPIAFAIGLSITDEIVKGFEKIFKRDIVDTEIGALIFYLSIYGLPILSLIVLGILIF